MSRQTPYLQRRGYGLTFRISVPHELRSIIGAREITKALPTINKNQAMPMVLVFAARAKSLFGELRATMSAPNSNGEQRPVMDFDKLRERMVEVKHRLNLNELTEQHEDELLVQRRQHKQELEKATLFGDLPCFAYPYPRFCD